MSAERIQVMEFEMTKKDKERSDAYPALIEAMRTEHIAQDKVQSEKIKFGLFSQPGPVAIGETNYFPKTKPRKDPEEGFVVIGPRNFTTMPLKHGSIDTMVNFSAASKICCGDLYKNPVRNIKRPQGANPNPPVFEEAFRPAKVVRDMTHMKASYEYMAKDVHKKKNYRDPEDNSVVIGPRNFTTMPPKKGQSGRGCYFTDKIDYMPMGFEHHKAEQRKELDHFRKTRGAYHDDKNFFQRVKQTESFNTHKQILEEDVPIKARPKTVRQPSLAEHERAFRSGQPIRTGQTRCTLEQFPAYKEDPPREKQRKKPVEGEDEPPPGFRMTHRYKSRPSTSIVCNMRNLKASFPSAFRR